MQCPPEAIDWFHLSKLEMEIQIISRETIKPSSPTPHHLRTHKLSLLDQLVPPVNIPVLLFYSATAENPRKRSLQLKESLSKTLVHFYTFAGRLSESFSIDCNDNGATYIEAQVAIDMSVVLKEPEIDLLLQLLPCDPHENLAEPSAQVVLSIQVNYFACGGMAICVCVHHAVADASAVATFLQSWAAVACGANLTDTETFDCTSLFPRQDLSGFWEVLEENKDLIIREDVVTTRFLFDRSKIDVLRDEIGNGSSLYRPTRVEAVSALIWNAMVASIAEYDKTIPIYVATSVNLRKRMNFPFPQKCVANVSQFIMTELPIEKTKNLSNLAGNLHDSITKVDDEYVRKLHAGGAYLNIMKGAIKGFGKNWIFSFSSWCRFPFYETDFGWGKPIWFGTTLRLNRVAFFLDTNDGGGIEAWITLTQEEMVKLEQDTGILDYATFKPST
ncbi:3'-N-debenzoyl-2'-deoxytaxol N-benzoyltransferase, putative [Theobroma cacao]|uniref:3'-N-debenzoyl-2'-deoxytaxol N-benzoyltransferase, putative n=1 Tax=Theobroma cacao TaxID=3641 RepID=A0A061FXX7_THECC|nr:3'-N-debenzoyl-2'-deoxytaxol N-benzoyltransferase, putative [Theobroma cacao]